MPFFKLNFDGASKGNLGRSGIGAVLRDSASKVLKVIFSRILDGSNNVAEATTLMEGVKLALSMGISRLHIEGDSQIITSALISQQVVSWDLQ